MMKHLVHVLACLLFATAVAEAASISALEPQYKAILEAGKGVDGVMRRGWQLMPKLQGNSADAGLVNAVTYFCDLGGSWTYQVRQGAIFAKTAEDIAQDKNDAEAVAGVFGRTLSDARAFFEYAVKMRDANGKYSDNPEVQALAADFIRYSSDALGIIKSMQEVLGERRLKQVNSGFLLRCGTLEKRALELHSSAGAVRKSVKSGYEENLASEIMLQAMYIQQELTIAAETAAYALAFPTRVTEQGKLDGLRASMTKYATHIQRDLDKFHNRLVKYVSTTSNPAVKQAHASLLELNTSVQGMTVDLMSVVSSGRDPSSGVAGGGPDRSAPAPGKAKAAGKQKEAGTDKPNDWGSIDFRN